MNEVLSGRSAIVTGAARGVGRAVAVGLAEAGADVGILDRCHPLESTPYPMSKPEELGEVKRAIEAFGRRCVCVQADVTDLPAVEAAMQEFAATFGHIDIVVANAGIFTYAKLWELTEQQWDETIDINLKGTWITLKAVVPHMIEHRFGRIICINSTSGLRGGPTISHYVASKHGVIGLARSLAMEVGSYGITVNCVCPSRMKTPMVTYEAYYEAFAGPGASEEDLGRLSRREQVLPIDMVPVTAVRDAVVWLASDSAAYLTGCAIPVDAGGLLI
jgi:SDR family mycofactocin-dependent oxidoreductase